MEETSAIPLSLKNICLVCLKTNFLVAEDEARAERQVYEYLVGKRVQMAHSPKFSFCPLCKKKLQVIEALQTQCRESLELLEQQSLREPCEPMPLEMIKVEPIVYDYEIKPPEPEKAGSEQPEVEDIESALKRQQSKKVVYSEESDEDEDDKSQESGDDSEEEEEFGERTLGEGKPGARKGKPKFEKGTLCTICGKTFKTPKTLENHQKDMHFTKDCPCPICHKIFRSDIRLKYHTDKVHAPKRFFCEICGSGFRFKNDVRKHILYNHDKVTKTCEVCGETMLASSFTEHKKKHTNLRSYKCPYEGCISKFNTAQVLRKHLYSHTQTRPFNCLECGRGYYQVLYLAQHYKRQHGITYTVREARINCRKEQPEAPEGWAMESRWKKKTLEAKREGIQEAT